MSRELDRQNERIDDALRKGAEGLEEKDRLYAELRRVQAYLAHRGRK